jgi:aminoglycoside 3-N-acetyltransferase I
VSGIHIRRASRDDRPALLALHRALNVDERKAVTPEAERPLSAYRRFDEVVTQDMLAMLASPQHHVLVATQAGGAVIGYVTGRIASQPDRILDPKGIVGDWYVMPGARGEGTGHRLLQALLAWFRQEGCQMVESATLPNNARARALHERLGFREVEVRYRMRL